MEIRKRRLCNGQLGLGLDPFRAGMPLSSGWPPPFAIEQTRGGALSALQRLDRIMNTRSAITRRFLRSDNVRGPQQSIPARKQPSARGSRPLPRRNSLVSKPEWPGTPRLGRHPAPNDTVSSPKHALPSTMQVCTHPISANSGQKTIRCAPKTTRTGTKRKNAIQKQNGELR
ncbi:MAG: hypothetical protein DMG13_09000 [Acidobacteria bacterium]|nr:MAG: hypothetical protein DMG13_09000 [Acidobacteriota bacterium]